MAFRLAAFASWDILCPLEISASVALYLPENETIFRTLSEVPRSARGGDVIALGLLSTPGAGCSRLVFRRYQSPSAPTFSYQPFREPQINEALSRIHCIILSNLALALLPGFGSRLVGHLTSSADTAPTLLSEHSEADIHLNTDGERILGIPSNSPERLRVARLTIYYTELFRIITLFGGDIQNFSVYPRVLSRIFPHNILIQSIKRNFSV